jgi:septal ring factor EnvC (AmiA/AmiB activator)
VRVALLLAVAAAAGVAVGWTAEDPPGELQQLRKRAAELERRLKEIEGSQQSKDRERQRLEAQLAIEVVRVQEAEATVRQLREREREAARLAEAGRTAHAAAVAQLQRQLGMLALLGRPGLAPLLLHAATSGSDVAARVTTVLAIVRQQEVERQRMADVLATRNASLAELSRRRAEADEAARQLAQRRQHLEETRRRVLAELAALEGERQERAVALASAQEAEARLERLWGVVTDGVERVTPDPRYLRGGLPWPVEGARIVTRFGARRDPRYGTVTVSHGIDLLVASGQVVTAVASGAVVHAQFVAGYGNVVILDHGRGVYSLYGRLASVLVRSGGRATMGEPVGMTGGGTAGEPNLYLEIRVAGKPQDPLLWLRPAGKRRTT